MLCDVRTRAGGTHNNVFFFFLWLVALCRFCPHPRLSFFSPLSLTRLLLLLLLRLPLLLRLLLLRLPPSFTFLYDESIEREFTRRALHDLFFDGVLRDEAEDVDLSLLADAVCAVHRLQVHLGVPVRVVQDHGVGRLQVDAETTLLLLRELLFCYCLFVWCG